MNGTNLQRLREEANLSRTQLAEAIGRSSGDIWRMEAGERDCVAETLRAIADTLATTLARPVGDVLAELTDPQ